VYRSAHNWIIDHYRRTPAQPLDAEYRADQPDGDPGEAAEKNILRERVRRALRLLTPEQQQVITLRFIEGWELDEIAATLEKPVGAIKALQHRGVAALRTMLAEREGSV
jgi:RNA polymerase sigma-70 factor (ECF subfamily)